MIFANIKDVLRYRGISENLDLALEHVNPEFLATLGNEPVELKGRDVYVFKLDLETKPFEACFYETHHDYADIHVVLEGAERMDIDIPEHLELYEEQPENDVCFFHGNGGQSMILTPDQFLVAFPEDGHKTCIAIDEPKPFTKVVFKIRL